MPIDAASRVRASRHPDPPPSVRIGGTRASSVAQAPSSAQRLPAGVSRASVAALSSPRRDAGFGARLERFFQDMHGPYIVAGQKVLVPTHFRSNGDAGKTRISAADAQRKITALIGPTKSKELAVAIRAATTSTGGPSQIRAVVQALLDAGAVSKSSGTPVEPAIRKLMWDLGIGVDCRRFVAHAFLYSRGEGLKPANLGRYNLDLSRFAFEQAFKKVEVAGARAGDIIHLDPLGGRDHNVIVRSNRLLPVEGKGLVVSGRLIPPSFAKSGWPSGATPSVRVLEVDACWGGGERGEFGGVERRVWVHNEKANVWAHWTPSGELKIGSGPYGHGLGGVYRPHGEP